MKNFNELVEHELEQLNEGVFFDVIFSGLKVKIHDIFCEETSEKPLMDTLKKLGNMIAFGKELFKEAKKQKKLSDIAKLKIRAEMLVKTKRFIDKNIKNPKLRCDNDNLSINPDKFQKEIDSVFDKNKQKVEHKLNKLQKKSKVDK